MESRHLDWNWMNLILNYKYKVNRSHNKKKKWIPIQIFNKGDKLYSKKKTHSPLALRSLLRKSDEI